MTRRRAHGSGSISPRGAGTWLVQTNAVDPVIGTRKRRSRVVHGSKRDAQDALTELLGAAATGDRRVDRSNATFRNALDAYFDALDGRVTASTSGAEESRAASARYIPDHLAAKPLRKIGPYALDALYRHLEARGGVCRRKPKCASDVCDHGGGRPLSPATVLRLHHDIHAALAQAVRWDWIRTNPADRVTLSDVVEDEVDVDPDEVIRLLAHIDSLPRDNAAGAGGTPLPAFVDTLLATGARVAEVCAIKWGQLDLDRVVHDEARPQLKIDASIARTRGGATRKTTKTRKTRRPVLDAYTTDMLRRRRADWLPAALAAGVPLDELHVFPSPSNVLDPIRPDVVSRSFRRARDAAGVDSQVTLRNLRHLVASLLADAGVHPTTIAGRLGHDPTMLLKRYAHILDTGNAAAADIVNRRLGRSS